MKFCGITRAADAWAAADLGAAAIGFIFAPKSPRAITPDAARAIAATLPPFLQRVGVFVDLPAADVRRVAEHVGLDVVQLHGDENVADYAGVPARLVKAVALGDEKSVETAMQLPPAVMPLADAFDAVRRGGTGQLAHWPHAAQSGVSANERSRRRASARTARSSRDRRWYAPPHRECCSETARSRSRWLLFARRSPISSDMAGSAKPQRPCSQSIKSSLNRTST